LENLQEHVICLDVYVNGNCVVQKTLTQNVEEQFLEFYYDYKVGANRLKVVFNSNQDQPHKLLTIHNVLIGKEHINVYRGYYKPYTNDFWKSLNAEDRKNMTRKCAMHGGNFGWYGEVEFEYFTYNHIHQTKQQNNFFATQRVAL